MSDVDVEQIVKRLKRGAAELEVGAEAECRGPQRAEPRPVEEAETPVLDQLYTDVINFGEVHATIAELGERDIRKADAEWDFERGIVTIDDGNTTHRVVAEHIIHWCRPRDF